MQKRYAIPALFLLIFTASVGLLARAQKTEEAIEDKGITLADLGVTEEQKAQLKALWELKRQKQIQAVKNLRVLNRLAKDPMASEGAIKEILEKFRQERIDQEQKIKAEEDALIKTLPTRAQLHLTLLGVLENGLTPHRFDTAHQKDENTEAPPNEK
ncbi:hypothetical protein HYR99_14015 [Candidatus Poribacteria bacterium]|nr:hypothetical protein [Candidatus Poribacteria bacterium]